MSGRSREDSGRGGEAGRRPSAFSRLEGRHDSGEHRDGDKGGDRYSGHNRRLSAEHPSAAGDRRNFSMGASKYTVCKYYATGQCKFGDKCRFLHAERGSGGKHDVRDGRGMSTSGRSGDAFVSRGGSNPPPPPPPHSSERPRSRDHPPLSSHPSHRHDEQGHHGRDRDRDRDREPHDRHDARGTLSHGRYTDTRTHPHRDGPPSAADVNRDHRHRSGGVPPPPPPAAPTHEGLVTRKRRSASDEGMAGTSDARSSVTVPSGYDWNELGRESAQARQKRSRQDHGNDARSGSHASQGRKTPLVSMAKDIHSVSLGAAASVVHSSHLEGDAAAEWRITQAALLVQLRVGWV
eukprot:m.213221 g.213221  ORF g.213221 m.213221 type:complete len:349 (-) comp26440_c0_seq1:152-1198(-)